MSHYQKPKWIKTVLWIMLIGIALASVLGVIVPYLPSASDDINEMTADMNTGVAQETTSETIAPDSILNQFQSSGVVVSGDTSTGSN